MIQQITNYVSMYEQANITLAAGARPVMTECPAEFEEITAQADALLLNIGTSNEKRREAILQANEIAGEYRVPVVLDPVGAGASTCLRELALELLESGNISIVKGNAGEIFSLVRNPAQRRSFGSGLCGRGYNGTSSRGTEKTGGVCREV